MGMGLVTAGSRIIGFVRVLVIAAVLGTTFLGNTFQASNSVSNVLFELVAAGALSAALVPGFVNAIKRDAHPDVERCANALLGMVVIGLGALTMVAMTAAPAIARLLMSGAPTAAVEAQQIELATVLLWFFLPQVVLYAAGAIAIAVLQAHRRFLVGAVAPIASSVVLIATMITFRMLAGPNPGLELTGLEITVLGLGGSLAVVGFVGVPIVALHRSGIRFVPTFRWRGSGALEALRLSTWAVVLHAGLGLLLGAALIAGNGTAGGVVAFQVAWTFFLAPYAIVAQPIHTAILPELTVERDDPARFAASVRWALAGMARILIPLSAVMFAFAAPAMRVVAFGGADPRLLSTALAWLAVGLFPYGVLFLATRAFFALGDTRTPAIITMLTSIAGAAFMLLAGAITSGRAVIVSIAVGQTLAVTWASVVLLAVLRGRHAVQITPAIVAVVSAIAIPLGFALLVLTWNLDVSGRWATSVVYGVITLLLVGAYGFLLRVVPGLRLPDRRGS